MKVIDGGRIARKRRRLGYTQTDLAALVGYTQQYISLLERGDDSDCSEEAALKISKRLNCDLEDLFEERSTFGAPKNPSPKLGHKRVA